MRDAVESGERNDGRDDATAEVPDDRANSLACRSDEWDPSSGSPAGPSEQGGVLDGESAEDVSPPPTTGSEKSGDGAPILHIATRSRRSRRPSESTARRLVELLENAGVDYFHTRASEAFARIEVADHLEVHAVRSASFRRHLAHLLYRADDAVVRGQDLADAIRYVEARAVIDGVEAEVHVRVARFGDEVFLDLADSSWRTVAIGPGGWRVEPKPPVLFRRGRGVGPLPIPQHGGHVSGIWRHINLADHGDRLLALAWLLGGLRGSGPYPSLVLTGEQGAGKSTVARQLKQMIDPSVMPLRALPRNERDFLISANGCHVLAFDNLSVLQPWQADAICKMSTGGGLATRELFSDAEEILFHASRPQILTGIGGFLDRPDLVDRSLVVAVPRIADEHRVDEDALWSSFHADHSHLLGALLDCLSAVLRNLPNIRLEATPRMADFARVGAAAEEVMGGKKGDFLRAYARNRLDAVGDTIAENPIVIALDDVVDEAGWSGRYADLLAALVAKVDDRVTRQPSWPKSPGALSASLSRLTPELRRLGLFLEVVREADRMRRKRITILRKERPHHPTARASNATPCAEMISETDAPGPAHSADDPDDELRSSDGDAASGGTRP